MVDFLVRDELFPRSILYAVAEMEQALLRIVNGDDHLIGNPASLAATTLRQELESTDSPAVIADGLHEFLDRIQKRIEEIHAAIQDTFIDYPTSRAKILA